MSEAETLGFCCPLLYFNGHQTTALRSIDDGPSFSIVHSAVFSREPAKQHPTLFQSLIARDGI
jgi:hypothetical protein